MQIYKLLTIIALGIFFLILQISFSINDNDQNTNYSSMQIAFNVQQLDKINQSLINKSLKITAVQKLQGQIDAIKNYAIQCSASKKTQLLRLNKLSQELNLNTDLMQEFSQDQKNLLKDNSNCQLLLFQAEKTTSLANNLFLQTNIDPNYKNIVDLYRDSTTFSFNDIHFKPRGQIFGTWQSDFMEILFEVFLFCIIIGTFVSKIINHYAKKINRPIRSKIYVRLSYVFTPLLTMFGIWLCMFKYTEELISPPPIVNIMYFGFIFILLKFIADIYLKLVYNRQINNPLWIKKTYRHINLIFFITFIHYSYSFLILNMMIENNSTTLLIKFANIFNILICLEWLKLFKQFRSHEFIYHKKFEQISIVASYLVSLLYLLRVLSSLFGTNYEFDEIISNITLKLFTFGIFVYFCYMSNTLFQDLEQFILSNRNLSKWLTYQKRHLWEFNLIKICLLFIVMIYAGSYMLEIFQFPEHVVLNYDEFFFKGFIIGTIRIAPCILLYSLLTFCLFSSLGKFVAFMIVSNSSLQNEEDKKNTLEKVFRYSLYILSFVVTLSIWGIKIQEVYYLIGALGLGIGIGLQSLVMDTISGLLILIIKPIQIGDYITILSKERISGYVHEINFLSTQIISHHSNMTRVPNGDLIREFILNYSKFQTSSYCFLTIKLKKIKDFETSKQIILETLHQKKEIIQTDYNKPIISFECLEDAEGRDYFVVTIGFNVEHAEDKKFILSTLEKEIIDKLIAKGIKLVDQDDNQPFIQIDETLG